MVLAAAAAVGVGVAACGGGGGGAKDQATGAGGPPGKPIVTRSPDIRLGDRRERDELDRVDLDHTGTDPVAAALLDLRPLPQPDRQRDIARQDVIAQLAAELHISDASR